MKKHWYLITVFGCPVCGNSREYRERQYTERPADDSKRYVFKDVYDWCNE